MPHIVFAYVPCDFLAFAADNPSTASIVLQIGNPLMTVNDVEQEIDQEEV